MRRKDKEITNTTLINSIISKATICRIALNDTDFPYIVPLNYGYRDGVFYFHSSKKGKKIELIQQNNKVGFEIDFLNETITSEIPCNWTTKYQSIIGFGTLEIVDELTEIIKGLDIIMRHHGKLDANEYNTVNLKNIVLLKLTPLSLTAKQSGDWD